MANSEKNIYWIDPYHAIYPDVNGNPNIPRLKNEIQEIFLQENGVSDIWHLNKTSIQDDDHFSQEQAALEVGQLAADEQRCIEILEELSKYR